MVRIGILNNMRTQASMGQITKYTNATQSYPELNWLRGFAAIAVMLFHYTVRYDQIFGHCANWSITVPWGGAMVISFFILSGFLGLLSNETSAKHYLWKRIVRLYPTYWICILCTVLVMKTAFPLYNQLPDSSIALKDILLNFTMLQGFLLQPSVDGAYWTLAIDLRFYVFCFLILLFKQRPQVRKYLFSWIFISLILEAFSYLGLIENNNGAFRIFTTLLMHIFVPNFCAAFTAGAFLALYSKEKKKSDTVGLLLSTILAFITFKGYKLYVYVATVGYVYICVKARQNRSTWIIYSKVISALDFYVLNVFTFVASISYPLYLLHQHIGFAIIWHLENANYLSEWIIIIPILTMLVLAYIVQKLEKTLINRVRKGIRKCKKKI